MAEKHVRHIVSKAIAAAQPSDERYYHLCWWEGSVQCLHVRHTQEAHTVFFSAPGAMLNNSLSSHQWKLISTRIIDFCTMRGIPLSSQSRSTERTHDASAVQPRRQVTDYDAMRLRMLLATAQSTNPAMKAPLGRLQQLLETADVVAPRDVPGNVVTMNSRVRLRDDHDGADMVLSLVFPADATTDTDFESMKVSVLTPIGLSLLGQRVGDIVEGRISVHELLYQPEAAGDFAL
ncbi:MAG: GreA/GreB family elongation factor [Sedimentisphaerales bacterium]|nr:GreA/GreB family elongation factor [Sedimentisphaerales bacterium]